MNHPIKNRSHWIVSLLIVVALMLAACGAGDTNDVDGTVDTDTSAEVTQPAPTEAPAEEPAGEAAPTEAPTETPTEAPAEEVAESESAPVESTTSEPTTFTIVYGESDAQFELTEDLFGQFTVVTGVTRDLAGELTVDSANPSASSVGVITINASTLATDNNRRNGAINRFILETNRYPNITFTPDGLQGMPEGVSVGDTFTFQLIGDLQIKDIVRQETFDVTVTAVSESEISGSAATTVLRENYDLSIPSVPSVANVSNEVDLTLNFVARAGE